MDKNRDCTHFKRKQIPKPWIALWSVAGMSMLRPLRGCEKTRRTLFPRGWSKRRGAERVPPSAWNTSGWKCARQSFQIQNSSQIPATATEVHGSEEVKKIFQCGDCCQQVKWICNLSLILNSALTWVEKLLRSVVKCWFKILNNLAFC